MSKTAGQILIVVILLACLFGLGLLRTKFEDIYVRPNAKRVRLHTFGARDVQEYEQELEAIAARIRERFGRAFERAGWRLVCEVGRYLEWKDKKYTYLKRLESSEQCLDKGYRTVFFLYVADPRDQEVTQVNKRSKELAETVMWEVSQYKPFGFLQRTPLPKFQEKLEKGVQRMAKEFGISLQGL